MNEWMKGWGKGGRKHAIEIKGGKKKVLKSNNDNGEQQRRKRWQRNGLTSHRQTV